MVHSPVIAILEDDEAMREALSDLLQVLGLACRSFDRAETFLAACEPGGFACLITDVQLPGLSGLELLQHLKARGSAMPVIVMTSHADAGIRARAMAGGAHAFLTKPVADDVLLGHLRSALRHDGRRGEGDQEQEAPDG